MSKQLKALYETKEMLEKKYRRGESWHHWDNGTCPLCKFFPLCMECPFSEFSSSRETEGCIDFKRDYYSGHFFSGSAIDESLSIIVAMIDAWERLEEMR